MPRRLQLSRRRGWRLPANARSVARPGRYGNPFRIAVAPGDGTDPRRVTTAAEAVSRYRDWLEHDPEGQATLVRAFHDLAGFDLACWCALDAPCHADVLLEHLQAR